MNESHIEADLIIEQAVNAVPIKKDGEEKAGGVDYLIQITYETPQCRVQFWDVIMQIITQICD